MTRDEAVERLLYEKSNAGYLKRLGLYPTSEQWSADDVYISAINLAIAALRGTEPDPATGLKGCLFCKEMDDYKALQTDPAFAYEHTAAIVSRLYKDGSPRARATSTNYGNGKYVLNYCPMCGRKLEAGNE
jgi:hypothetical protein